MNIYTHFLFPFVIASVLAKFNIISWKLAFVCGLIGMFVDVDHYIEQIIHSKINRFSLKSAWNNAIRFHRFNQRSFIHYGIGALILTFIFLILAFFSWRIALISAIGYYSHLLLDYTSFKREKVIRWKLGGLYMKESVIELLLDLILILILVFVIYL